MRRFIVPLCLFGVLLAAPATSNAALFGFSEQQSAMFDSPHYKALKKVRVARYIAPWDVAKDARDRAIFDAWYAGARANKDRILVSFYLDRDNRKKLPSLSAYRKALTSFKKRWPGIEAVSPWNEANHKAPGRFANPSAKRAAQYYNIARRVFRGKKIVGLDVLDSTNIKATVRYIKAFKRAVKVQPKYWGAHNYSDTNRFRNKGTKAILKATRGGELWLTETGGVVQFGSNFPYNEARAARALNYMFKLARSNRRIKRLYIYQWTAAAPSEIFDAGVIGPDGTPRPGYDVIKKRLG